MRKEGLKFILPLAAAAAGLLWTASRTQAWSGWAWLGGVALALALFCLNFFRDPRRVTPQDPSILVSPADGRVIAVEPVQDPYVGRAVEIRIFLNVFNVHAQRSPFTSRARVEDTRYHPGKFLNASAPKASLLNEQNWIYMKGAGGTRVVVKQIAGLIARRILCWVKKGDRPLGGQHIGFIQFGSQVDLVFPAAGRALVEVGRRVVGGETPLVKLGRVRSAAVKKKAAKKKAKGSR